jgi:hypothetical protein
MNAIFPKFQTVSSASAKAGTLIKINNSQQTMALVTNGSSNEKACSMVVLTDGFGGRPPIYFAKDWQNVDDCIAFENIQFEINIDPKYVDERGYKCCETSGALISIHDQLFLKAAPFQQFSDSYKHANIQTGELFVGQIPSKVWTFTSWRIVTRELTSGKEIELFKFETEKTS